MQTIPDSPLKKILRVLSNPEKTVFGVWNVYQVCKTDTYLTLLIEKYGRQPGLFLRFISLLECVWKQTISGDNKLDCKGILEIRQTFCEISWGEQEEEDINDEHNFRKAGFLLDASEFLLTFLDTNDDNALGWSMECLYNLRDYEASFDLCQNVKVYKDERQNQLKLIDQIKSYGVDGLVLSKS